MSRTYLLLLCTPLSYSFSATPSAMLMSCGSIGAISFFFEYFNPPPAQALELTRLQTPSVRKVTQKRATQKSIWQHPSLPFLSLSLPCVGMGAGLGGGNRDGNLVPGVKGEGGRYHRHRLSAKLQLPKL